MKKIFQLLISLSLILSIIILPNFASAEQDNSNSKYLTQEEIDILLENESYVDNVDSLREVLKDKKKEDLKRKRAATEEEILKIEKHIKKIKEKSPDKEIKLTKVLLDLGIDDIEVISENELNTQSMNILGLPNAGTLSWKDGSRGSNTFSSMLYAVNIGLDPIDQIGGRVYGYSNVSGVVGEYIKSLDSPFNESSLWPGTTNIRSYSVTHYSRPCALKASYVVNDDGELITNQEAIIWSQP